MQIFHMHVHGSQVFIAHVVSLVSFADLFGVLTIFY